MGARPELLRVARGEDDEDSRLGDSTLAHDIIRRIVAFISRIPQNFAVIKLGFLLRQPESLLAFCDEASHTKERFFVLGAVYFIAKESVDLAAMVAKIEQELAELKQKSGLDRLKWGKVPISEGKYLDGYKQFIKEFLETEKVYFKCIVIDTQKYPLRNAKRWAGNALVGYQKFYCVFLADGLMQRYPNYFYEIVLDEFSGVDYGALEYACIGRYVKKVGPKVVMNYCAVKHGNDQTSSLLQLVDLLVGMVAFVWNGGMERESKHARTRQEIVKLVEKELKLTIGEATYWGAQKFNIWEFRA